MSEDQRPTTKLNADSKQRETESEEIRDKYFDVKQRLADESVEKQNLKKSSQQL